MLTFKNINKEIYKTINKYCNHEKLANTKLEPAKHLKICNSVYKNLTESCHKREHVRITQSLFNSIFECIQQMSTL